MMSSQIPRERDREFGLKEDWGKVEEALQQVIPVYDKVNRYISFGRATRLRSEGIEILTTALRGEAYAILDLGSGPGNMTKVLFSRQGERLGISLMVDALLPMMRFAKKRNPQAECVISVFENLPLRGGIFDATMAGFSIRDAKELSTALTEIRHSLKRSGYFLLVDLSKPDSRAKRTLIGFYWRALAPIIAFFASGRIGLKFAALSKTYSRLPRISRFVELAERCGFKLVTSKYSMLGGACILLFQAT